jgi:hypothetical protein
LRAERAQADAHRDAAEAKRAQAEAEEKVAIARAQRLRAQENLGRAANARDRADQTAAQANELDPDYDDDTTDTSDETSAALQPDDRDLARDEAVATRAGDSSPQEARVPPRR